MMHVELHPLGGCGGMLPLCLERNNAIEIHDGIMFVTLTC